MGASLRKIRLMPEYDCFPLWEEVVDGVKNVDPSTLPLSPELQQDLDKWADDYESTMNPDYPPESGFPSAEIAADFDGRGHELWQRLTKELTDNAKISYYSVTDGTVRT